MVIVASGDISSSTWNPWATPGSSARYLHSPYESWTQHFLQTMPSYYCDAMDSFHQDHNDMDDMDGVQGGRRRSERQSLIHLDQQKKNEPSRSTQVWPADQSECCQCHQDQCDLCAVKSDFSESDSDTDGYWVKDLHLTTTDRDELLSGEMLSDKHMFAAQKLLSEQFPGMGGLQDTCLSQTEFKPADTDCIQIHHTRGNHWVLTSRTAGDIIEVYDTIYHTVTKDLLRQMDEIYVTAPRSPTGKLQYRICDLHKQKGSRDCGLFVVALAFELCLGYDVSDIRFNQSELRKHLYKCFRQKHLESFPTC